MQAPERRISNIAAVSVLILPVLYAHFFSRRFFYEHFVGADSLTQNFYQFGGALILFLIIPLFAIKFYFRRSPREFGLCAGDFHLSLRYIVSALILLPLFLYIGSKNSEMAAEYPLFKGACTGFGSFVPWEILYLLYYIAWEFYFRGFLLFGAAKSLSAFYAVIFQSLPSILLHIGKPAPELFASIAAGVIFGAIALHTRSILAPLVIHYYVGILTDLFCCY